MTNNTPFRLTLSALALLGFAGLTACNTMEGAGKDVQSAGEKIEHEADKANK